MAGEISPQNYILASFIQIALQNQGSSKSIIRLFFLNFFGAGLLQQPSCRDSSHTFVTQLNRNIRMPNKMVYEDVYLFRLLADITFE